MTLRQFIKRPSNKLQVKQTVIPKGKRNNTLTSIAGKLLFTLRGEINYDIMVCFLQSVNVNLCQPPLRQQEVNRIMYSMWSKDSLSYSMEKIS